MRWIFWLNLITLGASVVAIFLSWQALKTAELALKLLAD